MRRGSQSRQSVMGFRFSRRRALSRDEYVRRIQHAVRKSRWQGECIQKSPSMGLLLMGISSPPQHGQLTQPSAENSSKCWVSSRGSGLLFIIQKREVSKAAHSPLDRVSESACNLPVESSVFWCWSGDALHSDTEFADINEGQIAEVFLCGGKGL